MALPGSGSISLSQVNTELGRAATTQISLGETAVRGLAGVASGTISLSNLLGKSSGIAMTAVQANRANPDYGIIETFVGVITATHSFNWSSFSPSGSIAQTTLPGTTTQLIALGSMHEFNINEGSHDIYLVAVFNGNVAAALAGKTMRIGPYSWVLANGNVFSGKTTFVWGIEADIPAGPYLVSLS